MRISPRLSSIILYSIIPAAFVGPGTITTAVAAGATHQLQLLWAVTLSMIGCFVLQEVSARIVISSGLNLAQASRKSLGEKTGRMLTMSIGGTVILGCAAYQAGNIMGAVAGMNLLIGVSAKPLAVVSALAAFVVLWTNKRQMISWLMAAFVGMMGLAFFVLAFRQPFSVTEIFSKAAVPNFPQGSELLILGLVGTTIVPYNIFLGSGISKGKTVPLMRVGLTVSVFIGGLITAAILIAGTSVGSFSSFPELAASLRSQLGPVGSLALGFGLFAAGFSSSITAPYASSIIASTIFGWEDQRRLRLVWGAVLLIGFLFGISGIKPIPVILTVQALNGLILPMLVALLIVLINHKKIIPAENRHGLAYNILLLLIFGSVLLIGLNQVDRACISSGIFSESHFNGLVIASVLLVMMTGVLIYRKRAG